MLYVLLVALGLLAQEAAPGPDLEVTLAGAITALTPVVIPLLVWGVRVGLPHVPSWLLPVLAAGLGVLLDYVNQLATAGGRGVVVGALLGLAGVGVREVVDQVTKLRNST